MFHENIWKDWIENNSLHNSTKIDNKNKYNVRLFIHAKHPHKIKSTWVKSKLISKNFEPEWNSVEVIRAMVACLEEALQDTEVEKFVFATG